MFKLRSRFCLNCTQLAFGRNFPKSSVLLTTFHKIHANTLHTPLNKGTKFSKMTKFEYPRARKNESLVDEYHGVKISDPYGWMEDPDSEETKKFVNEQNAISRPFLEEHPHREKVKAEMTKMWDFPKYSSPQRQGDHYFFFHNTGLQNHSVMYIQDSLDGEPRVFLDPNKLSEDGTVSLGTYSFSEDGKTLAYCLSSSGSDWTNMHFKDVATEKEYPEVLERLKFVSIAWTHDHKGVFYSRYPETSNKADGSENVRNQDQKLYYHYLNTPQKDDILIADFPEDPLLNISPEISDCGRWLIVHTMKDCKNNMFHYCDLDTIPDRKIQGKLSLTQVVHQLDSNYEYITNEGSKFIFKTNKNAPNYRLITIDFNNFADSEWKTLIEENKDDVLDWATCVAKDKLILSYIHHVKNVMHLHDLNSGRHLHTFPLDVGTIVGFSGKKKYNDIFYSFMSFLQPTIIFHCSIPETVEPNTKLDTKIFREIKVPDFDPSLFETKQVFYPSKDGTKIPMFILSRKGVQLTNENPCILYGYGGFAVSLQPGFSVTKIVFLRDFNGVYAIPNIRGGGEYGERWHDGGRLLNKQNVFDDFQSAAEWLINAGYTKPERLAIQGGSNGGLLTAACINQKPELFGAAIVQVGVLDMLKFNKFTIGYFWESDYGSPANKSQFDYLLGYSPLHNIQTPKQLEGKQYPATLLMTADHDDRVSPVHSLKFAATLQDTLRDYEHQRNPLLIRIETKAGHGGGKPTTKQIEEITDVYCFLMKSLGFQFNKQ
uniref:Prolyl endopeptidase n=2 Tax=Cacopsylla melanoneura TaxID=428564 RepID=A0A8D8QBX9_9HEMI